MQAAQIFL